MSYINLLKYCTTRTFQTSMTLGNAKRWHSAKQHSEMHKKGVELVEKKNAIKLHNFVEKCQTL